MSTDLSDVPTLQARIHELEAALDARAKALSELTALYESQDVYLERSITSWCNTPFAARIAELETRLGI
jgi:uncharacterized coiled-coil protein SlyX